MAPVTHIVLFRFKDGLPEDTVKGLGASFLALKDECKLSDGSNYIISLTGGKQNSPEGLGKGLQYGFVVEFGSEEARKYYLETDSAHLAFAAKAGAYAADIVILDFSNGVL